MRSERVRSEMSWTTQTTGRGGGGQKEGGLAQLAIPASQRSFPLLIPFLT
jgi:hypothetical protein